MVSTAGPCEWQEPAYHKHSASAQLLSARLAFFSFSFTLTNRDEGDEGDVVSLRFRC